MKERRVSAMLDIWNAFIQIVVKEDKNKIIIHIRGLMVDIMQHCPQALRTLCHVRQEMQQATISEMRGCALWYVGCKSFVLLSEVYQESSKQGL